MEDDGSGKEEDPKDGGSKIEGYKQSGSMENEGNMENNCNNADDKSMDKGGCKKEDYKDCGSMTLLSARKRPVKVA